MHFDKPAKPTGTFIVQHLFFVHLMTAGDLAHLMGLGIKMCVIMTVLVIVDYLNDNNNSFVATTVQYICALKEVVVRCLKP